MVLETVSPLGAPESPTTVESDADDPSFHPGEYALEGDGSDGEASVEDLMDDEEEEDDDDDDDDDDDVDANESASESDGAECDVVEVSEGATVTVVGWPDGPTTATIGETKDVLYIKNAAAWDSVREVASPENTVALFKGGQFIARAVGIVSSGHATGMYPIIAADELAMMRTLVTMQIPASKKKQEPLEPLLVREATNAGRRGLNKSYRNMLDAYGVAVTVGKKTQQRWLSQRALAFSKHTAPYRALIEKFKQQDTESKAKRRESKKKTKQPTIEKHLDDAAAAAPEPPVPPEPSAPAVAEGLLTPAESPVVAPVSAAVDAKDPPVVLPECTPDVAVESVVEPPADELPELPRVDDEAVVPVNDSPRKRSASEELGGRPAKMVIIVTDDRADLKSILRALDV